MVYVALTAVLVILAFALFVIAFKALIKPTWLLGWLKGTSGLLLVCLAILMTLAALDFYSYRQLERDKSIANLSFVKITPQHYQVSVVANDGKESIYELAGDLWQLDVRILKWSSGLSAMGLLPGYRLDRISGRYVSLEEEKNRPRSVNSLYNNEAGFDVWSYLKEYGRALSILESNYGSATYLPMKDGALYTVKLTQNGLAASPLNDRAKEAVAAWQ